MESNPSNTVGIPAQYGKACANCARAKAKCVNNSSLSEKCERCHRLNKDCQRALPARTRKAIKKTTKVDRLEEKLDGLVTLLRSTNQPNFTENGSNSSLSPMHNGSNSSNHSVHNHLTPDSLQPTGSSPKSFDGDQQMYALTTGLDRERVVRHNAACALSLNVPVLDPNTSYTASGTRSTTYHSSTALSVRLEPSLQEAEEFLEVFKMEMMQYSPFITIEAATTAQQLRRERPFLWLCIMAITSKSTEQQKALGREIRLTIGREILVEGKNNLDLLVGILTYTAWGHFTVYDRPIITNLMQLAMGLVANLGLKKLPPKEPPQLMLDLDSRGCPKPFITSVRTMEERRLGLWCWLVSSIVSIYFQRLESQRWIPYFEECLQMLAERRESPADMFLVLFVRLQLIVEKAAQAPWHGGSFDASMSVRAPLRFYLKALQTQLQDFRQAIPLDLSDNRILHLHIYSTELMVHEVALLKAPVLSTGSDFQRLDSLYACLHAVKNWFDALLTPSPASFLGVSMAVFTQMSHCIVALYRLSTLEYPGWDCGVAREFANLSTILGQIVERMAQVKYTAGLDVGIPEDKDIFSVSSRSINSIKTWWDSKVAAEPTGPAAATLDETMAEPTVDFWDDSWLQDVLGAGPHGFEPFTQ